MQYSSSFRWRSGKRGAHLGEQMQKGKFKVQWVEEGRNCEAVSNLMIVWFHGHMELIWALTVLKPGKREDKINKYVERNETHNYKREFGINLEVFPRSCISIAWAAFEFCVKLKIRFYNFMSCRDIKIFYIVLSTWHS